MAPELFVNKLYDGKKVDIFAAGVVLFLMTVGHAPFGRADPRDSFYRFICKNREDLFWKYHTKYMESKNEEFSLSKELRELIGKMLSAGAAERISLKDLKASAWYNEPLPTREELMKELQGATLESSEMLIEDVQSEKCNTIHVLDNQKMDLE